MECGGVECGDALALLDVMRYLLCPPRSSPSAGLLDTSEASDAASVAEVCMAMGMLAAAATAVEEEEVAAEATPPSARVAFNESKTLTMESSCSSIATAPAAPSPGWYKQSGEKNTRECATELTAPGTPPPSERTMRTRDVWMARTEGPAQARESISSRGGGREPSCPLLASWMS